MTVMHRVPCGTCERCLAGHQSTCGEFRELRIAPGGFAERLRAIALRAAARHGAASTTASGSSRSRASCARPSSCRPGACSSSAAARSAGSGSRCCARAATRSSRPTRARTASQARASSAPRSTTRRSPPPSSPRPPASTTRCARLEPGGTLLVFAAPEEPVPVALDAVYRKELTIVGSRSATPAYFRDAVELLPPLVLPPVDDAAARAVPRGRRALPPRRGAEGRLHAVKAALLYAPGDLRVEEVPRPEPGPGDVLVQVEVALTDGTDLKTYRRGHPLLARESPAPFGHEFCGLVDGRRVVAANSAPCGVVRRLRARRAVPRARLPRRRVRGLARRAGADRGRQPARGPAGARARGRGDGRAARVLPARRRARRDRRGRPRSRSSAPARSG